MEKKTLRLVYPQWHGGVNPNYVFGSKLLSYIAPPSETDETFEIGVKTDFDSPVAAFDGIDCGEAILKEMKETWRVLNEKSRNG